MLEFNGTFIILALSFILFTLLMKFIFYSPMNEVRSERKKYVDGNLNTVELNNSKIHNLDEKKEKRIIKVKRESSEYVNKHTSEANQKRNQEIQGALKVSKEQVQSAKDKLEKEKMDVKEGLKLEVSKLASEVSKKILGNEIAMSVSDEAIEKALSEQI